MNSLWDCDYVFVLLCWMVEITNYFRWGYLHCLLLFLPLWCWHCVRNILLLRWGGHVVFLIWFRYSIDISCFTVLQSVRNSFDLCGHCFFCEIILLFLSLVGLIDSLCNLLILCSCFSPFQLIITTRLLFFTTLSLQGVSDCCWIWEVVWFSCFHRCFWDCHSCFIHVLFLTFSVLR